MGVQYTMQATEYHGFSCQFRTFRFSSSYTSFFFFYSFILLLFSRQRVFSISLPFFLSLSLILSFSHSLQAHTHRTAHTRNALREITAIKIRRETKRDRWLSKILMELQWKDRNLSQGPVTRRYGPDPRPEYRAILSFSNSRQASNFIGFFRFAIFSKLFFRLFETRKRRFSLKIKFPVRFRSAILDREKWSAWFRWSFSSNHLYFFVQFRILLRIYIGTIIRLRGS